MSIDNEAGKKSRSEMIGVRVDEDEKALVSQAAEREGLQLSSFIIMMLVRLRILPESSLKKIKRRPVPFYNALHGLLGVVNNIGGNCKQLISIMPNLIGLAETHDYIIQTASAITDALLGRTIPEGINFYRLQENLTKEGYRLNHIAKSVNMGEPDLTRLPTVLAAINDAANATVIAMTGTPLESGTAQGDNAKTLRQIIEESRNTTRR